MEDEDLIPVQDIMITLSSNGYIKRITSDTYRVQNRGGKGIKGMELNKDDVIDQFVSLSTHDNLLIFTNLGRVYRIRGFNVPEYSRTSKGLPIVNLLPMDKEEKVKALVPYGREDEAQFLFFVTRKGLVKRTTVEEFSNINKNGKIALKLNEDDELAFVKGTKGNEDILIAISNGKVVRFKEDTLRPLSRTAIGVKGANIDGGEVIGMATSEEGNKVLTVTENGYGKLSELEEFRATNRGAKGVKALTVNEKTGNLVCLKAVQGNIAASLAVRDEDPEIPSGKTNGPNLYDKEWDREKIHEYVDDKLQEEPAKIFLQKMNIDTDKGEDIRKKALQVICDNIWNVKINNYPEDNAPSRGEMPQTDKAGQQKGSKPSSYPDKEGSALNRMKNGKFDSGAIK